MSLDFRMSYVLQNKITLLRYLGMWPDGTRYFTKNNYTFCSFSMLLIFLLLDYIAVSANIFSYQADFEQISNTICYCAQRSITMVQVIFFLRKIGVMKKIMEQLNSDLIQPKTDEDKSVIMDSLKFYFLFTNTYFIFCSVTCVVYVSLPILMGQRIYPFVIWDKLLYLESPWFEIVYVHQCIAVWLNHLIHSGIDMLSAGLMATIGSQCDFLRAKLLNFQPNGGKLEEDLDMEGNIDVSQYDTYFREVIEHHREILLLSKRVNILFSQLVFGEISLVIILLCTGLFRLSIVVKEARSEFLLVAAFVLAMSLQLFLYCWFGHEVYSKSERLHSGSFHCNWIGSPISFQKNLIFFMQKTSTPIKIYALHFFELSTITFTSIMRSSWSFYVLLQQLHNEEEDASS